MLFGSCMHKAMEYFNNTGDLVGAKTVFKKEWGRADPDYYPKGLDYAGLKTKGLESLDAMSVHYRFQNRVVIGTEIGFVVPFGEHELHGYIDLLEVQRSGTGAELLKVVDYKTASKGPTLSELALDIQFTAYHYAISQKEFWTGMPGNPDFPGIPNGEWLWETQGRDLPKRCVWFSLWNYRQLDAGPRTEVDYGRLYRVCEQIARATELEVFVPKIGTSCTWCDFTEQCSMEIPVSLRALEDTDDQTRWV